MPEQSLDLNSQATQNGKESSVVDYSYRTHTSKSEEVGVRFCSPTHPWCPLLTPALAPASVEVAEPITGERFWL